MYDASVKGLCSALGCRWEDELGVWECRLEDSSIWELCIEKRRAERLGIGTATVKDDDGLFVREGGQNDNGFWVLARSTFLWSFSSRHCPLLVGNFMADYLVVLVCRE